MFQVRHLPSFSVCDIIKSPANLPRYHVPSAVKQHIDYITPGIQLMSIGLQEAVTRKRRKEQSRKRQVEPDMAYMKPGSFVQGGCDRTVTPHCIKSKLR